MDIEDLIKALRLLDPNTNTSALKGMYTYRGTGMDLGLYTNDREYQLMHNIDDFEDVDSWNDLNFKYDESGDLIPATAGKLADFLESSIYKYLEGYKGGWMQIYKHMIVHILGSWGDYGDDYEYAVKEIKDGYLVLEGGDKIKLEGELK